MIPLARGTRAHSVSLFFFFSLVLSFFFRDQIGLLHRFTIFKLLSLRLVAWIVDTISEGTHGDVGYLPRAVEESRGGGRKSERMR